MLKPGYLRQRRLYLKHLVVGLYSHAFPCVALLAMLVLVGLGHWLAPWTGTVFGVREAALWVWLPLYLLLMQKRVYAQGWPMTVFKYLRSGAVLHAGHVRHAVRGGEQFRAGPSRDDVARNTARDGQP